MHGNIICACFFINIEESDIAGPMHITGYINDRSTFCIERNYKGDDIQVLCASLIQALILSNEWWSRFVWLTGYRTFGMVEVRG